MVLDAGNAKAYIPRVRGAMRPSEAKAIREEIGISQSEWAIRLGVTPAAVSRWESGTRPIPKMAANLMRLSASESLSQPA